MSELLKCTECAGTVSSSANACPHCGVKHFQDKYCAICKVPIISFKAKELGHYIEAINYPELGSQTLRIKEKKEGYRKDTWEYYSYEVPSDKQYRFYCEGCWDYKSHNELARSGFLVCKKCGHTTPLNLVENKIRNCDICSLILDENFGNISIEDPPSLNEYLNPDSKHTKYIHSLCYTAEVQRGFEQKRAKLEAQLEAQKDSQREAEKLAAIKAQKDVVRAATYRQLNIERKKIDELKFFLHKWGDSGVSFLSFIATAGCVKENFQSSILGGMFILLISPAIYCMFAMLGSLLFIWPIEKEIERRSKEIEEKSNLY
jgi:RNA polymerase subunit RPABC4/transcription elongation factor Spt4